LRVIGMTVTGRVLTLAHVDRACATPNELTNPLCQHEPKCCLQALTETSGPETMI